MKDTFLDVKAILSNGKRIIIEMQVLNVEGFEKRILFNAAKEYSNQLNAGEHHAMLSPVIALTITDFILFKDAICGVAFDKVISYFKLREKEKEKYIKYSDDVELIFIELPKFKKSIEEIEGITEKWIYFMKNAGKLDYIPETLAQDNEIKKAFDILNTAGMTEEELNEQRNRHTFIQMQKDILKEAMTAHEKGIKKGKVEGLKEGEIKGEMKGKVEIAKNLLKAGFEIDAIVTLTGLNQREIEDIR
jgi:predicted transposase/invertase (TIGR01784 family)